MQKKNGKYDRNFKKWTKIPKRLTKIPKNGKNSKKW